MTLDIGDPAPAVRAPNQDGTEVEPSFDEPAVVYFYPRDDTSGCTVEARLLADPDGEIADAFGVEVDESRNAAARTTFVLADGEVKAVYTGVRPDGHAREVLSDMLDAGFVDLDL